MNTPTHAQALGENERLARELDEFADNYGSTHLLIEDARAAAAALRQHGQHFAGLEAEVERLRGKNAEFLANWGKQSAIANAAEARCAELEAALSNSVGADWHNDEVANAARTNGEAREILAKAIDVVRDAATDARMAGHIKRGEYLDDLASIIAAFLSTSGESK